MSAENTRLYFYPVWLRIWHGINALGIILLIVTGISMQSGVESSFIRFNLAVNMHNIAGIAISANYIFYAIANIITKNIKFYLIKPQGFLRRPMKQARYYAYGMFKGMNSPYPLSEKRKFNPLQKLAYVVVMYLFVPVVVVTGFALLFPEIIIDKVYAMSGITLTAVMHSIMGFFISVFLLVHIYISSVGKSPLDNFKSIINGWHYTH